jgi:sulfur relay (sulfurtransferase) DsrF/TusC family protein
MTLSTIFHLYHLYGGGQLYICEEKYRLLQSDTMGIDQIR